MGLFSTETSYVGIDIGSTAIKAVELKIIKGRLRLVTYGLAEKNVDSKDNWLKDAKYIATVVDSLRKRANIKNTTAVASLPTFSVFSSILYLANISKKDLTSAIQWEAKKVIPLALEEMVLDWKVIEEGGEVKDKKNTTVLLTGAPKNLVKKYLTVFELAGIKLSSLETETFSLIRSLIGNDQTTTMIVEIGAGTTDISIVKKSIPIVNRSLDIGGIKITESLSASLNMDLSKAEQFKLDLGASGDLPDGALPKSLEQSVNPIVNEIKYIMNSYSARNNEKIEKIILSGGSCWLPNLPKYLEKMLNTNVIIGDPWARISYPVELKPLLDEIGPRMSVSIGLAMRAASQI